MYVDFVYWHNVTNIQPLLPCADHVSCESSTCPLFIYVCCCLLLFSSRSFHNLGMLVLAYFSCMLHFVTCTNVSLFYFVFSFNSYRWYPSYYVAVCSCIVVLFLFHFYFIFIVVNLQIMEAIKINCKFNQVQI